jgi:malate dehydrogenase
VRVLVVGNPCNTNCLIAMHNAPDVPRSRFHAMMRLDQNRSVFQLAKKAGVPNGAVTNAVVWGNHSANQVPDYLNARISGKPATAVINDLKWLQGDFMSIVGKRGAAIIEARGKSSAASAAAAAIDAVKALITPTAPGTAFSTAIYSDGNPYGVPAGLIFGFPCRSKGDGNAEIVPGFASDDFLKAKLKKSIDELTEERAVIQNLLG